MPDLEDNNNLDSNAQTIIEVENSDEDIKRLSQANEFLLILNPDIHKEEEKAELSLGKKDSLYFSADYEPTKKEAEEREKNIENSSYELRKFPEPSRENNCIIRNLEERAKTPEIEKPKTLTERFDQLLKDHLYLRNFNENGLTKKYGREILKFQKERYPNINIQEMTRLPSNLATVKEYYQEERAQGKEGLKDGTTVEDIVFRAMERMEILGDNPNFYNVAKGISGSDPTSLKIPVEEFIKFGTADETTWNTLIDELKNIPCISDHSLIRFWNYSYLLHNGLDQEQREQLEHLKKYPSYLYTVNEEDGDKDREYYSIIDKLICKKVSFESFKRDQEIRTGDNFSAHPIPEGIDNNELAFRLLSLRHGVDISDNAYEIFPYREKLRDMILESAKGGKNPKLINEQFSLWKNMDSLNIELYAREQEAILNALTDKENDPLISKVLLYSKGDFKLSEGFFALRIAFIRHENSTALKKDFLDSINWSISSFEKNLIAVSQNVKSLEIKDAMELENIFRNNDIEKIGYLSTLSLLDKYSQEVPSLEQLKLMQNVENGKFFRNEKFFEYAYKAYFGEHRFGNTILDFSKEVNPSEDIKNPEAKIYWNTIHHLLKNSYELQAKRLIELSEETGFDYKEILNKYMEFDMAMHNPQFFLNSKDILTDELLNTIKDPERKELWKFMKNSDPNVAYFLSELFILDDVETPDYKIFSKYTNIVEGDLEKKRLPNAEFFKYFLTEEKDRLVNNANNIITREILESFPPADRYFWEMYLKINDYESKNSLLNYYSQSENLDLEQIKSVFALTERILNSPSAEIIRLKDNIIGSLSSKNKSLEESIADFEVLENIFVKNNSPVSISRWRVFNSLYLDTLVDYSHRSTISPLFESILSNEQYSRNQKGEIISSIIQKDLLNISKDSIDENLYNFLLRLKEGTEALSFYDSYLQEGYSDDEILESLGEKEKEYLNKSLDIFFTASNRSSHNEQISSRIVELRTLLDLARNQPLTSGIYKSYLLPLMDKPTGEITSDIEKILSEMLSLKESAHQRGLKYFQEGVSIKKGDLLKNVTSLRGIIDNGIYARDFLGSNAGQDATPYDTDTVMIDGEVLIFSQAIKDYALSGYGDITLVIRDRGQFNTPLKEDTPMNSNSKYELIHSQVVAENHYGIRTGIATTEIDYIVISENMRAEDLSDIKFRIASKGIYIPIVNREGKIIYSPDEYETQRETFAGIPGIAYKPYSVDTNSERLAPTIRNLENKVIEDREKTNRISQNLQQAIEEELIKRNLLFENSITGLAGVRIENIGSTSRSTHLVGASDFDFSILMDRSQLSNIDINEKTKLINNVMESVGTIEQNGEFHSIGDNTTQMVGAKIKLKTGEIVEFDLAITDKGTNINGSNSHELVMERLNDIREREGEEKDNFVISNILIAKKIFKEYKCYKKGVKEGGLGGIGIENWILQHNGNFEKAANAFLQAATNPDGTKADFNTFSSRYTVYDPGKDLRTGENDNFVRNNMNEQGYDKMVEALNTFKNGGINIDQLFINKKLIHFPFNQRKDL